MILSAQPRPPISADQTRELTANYRNRASFEAAVTSLLAAGFDRTDLSVLASHDSLEVAGDIAGYHREDGQELVSALGQQVSWLEPVTIAGAVFLTAGPVGAAVAAIAAAAAGAVTLRPLLAEITENAHALTFEAAIADGHILLWVRIASAAQLEKAEAILRETGGTTLTRLAKAGSETKSIA